MLIHTAVRGAPPSHTRVLARAPSQSPPFLPRSLSEPSARRSACFVFLSFEILFRFDRSVHLVHCAISIGAYVFFLHRLSSFFFFIEASARRAGETRTRPIFCAEHRPDNYIDVTHRRCQAPRCRSPACYAPPPSEPVHLPPASGTRNGSNTGPAAPLATGGTSSAPLKEHGWSSAEVLENVRLGAGGDEGGAAVTGGRGKLGGGGRRAVFCAKHKKEGYVQAFFPKCSQEGCTKFSVGSATRHGRGPAAEVGGGARLKKQKTGRGGGRGGRNGGRGSERVFFCREHLLLHNKCSGDVCYRSVSNV